MKAIAFEAPIPTYLATRLAGWISDSWLVGRHACTHYTDVATPDLPKDGWVRIQTRMGGICGSDLGIIGLHASPSASPFSSFPFVLGHESVGTIESCGAAVRGFKAGDRVTVNPLLSCEPRGIAPCAACAAGHQSRCVNFTIATHVPPGMFIGTTRGLGGSWGEMFVAHQSQLVRIPDTMSDAGAVLIEPFACCVHAVRGAMPEPGQRILVIGAGTMGLLVVAALKALAPDPNITVLARHKFQARFASELGAGTSVLARGNYLRTLAEVAGTRLVKPILGRPIGIGGFDMVYVCSSSTRAVDDAMRFTRAGGTIVLLGNASTLGGLDWTPLWMKELTFRGTLAYGGHSHGGTPTHAFLDAAAMIDDGRAPVARLVTHEYPLSDYRTALQTARAKGLDESVKVVFRFE